MPSDESPKSAKGCLGCGGCLLVALVLLVLLVVVFLVWSMRSSHRVEEELSQIRAAGEPCTPAELDAFYQMTDAEKSTGRLWLTAAKPLQGAAYDKAAEELPIAGDNENEIPPPGQPWPDLAAVEEFLDQYADVLRQLHQAANAGDDARYPADFSQGINMRLDHVQSLRAAARMLALEAHARAHRGDAHGAAQSIHTMLMLADSLKQEPVIVSQLIRNALDGVAQEVLQQQLPTADFADEDLDRLQAHLRKVDYMDGLQRAFIGERVMGIQAMKNPGVGGPSGQPAFRGPQFFWNENLTFYVGYMSRVIAATKRPLPTALNAAERVADDLSRSAEGGSIFGGIGHALALQAIPAHKAVFEAAARSTASARAVDAVIAVERFRREHGRLPKGFEELVPKFLPQVPTDPYNGQPMRYAVKEGGYVIYSVGINGVDDGGHGNENLEPDLVFPVQRRKTEEEHDLPQNGR